jgi:hypothetical protein
MGNDPKEMIMALIQTLGPELVIALLTDDKLLGVIASFVKAVGQMQPEQRQQLAQLVQQMAQQGGSQGQEQAPPSDGGGQEGSMF